MKMTATRRTLEGLDALIQVSVDRHAAENSTRLAIKSSDTYMGDSWLDISIEALPDLIQCLTLFQAEQVEQRIKGEK